RHQPARLCDHDFGISAIMMNTGIFLVPTVHEIATATELAIAARAAEKSDTHALTNRPALDTGTKRIDPPNEFVARDARPINGELALYRAGIRVADPTRLDTNPDFTRRGRRQFPLHHFQVAGLTRLHCAIACRCHRRPLRFVYALLPLSHTLPGTGGVDNKIDIMAGERGSEGIALSVNPHPSRPDYSAARRRPRGPAS